MIFPYQCQECNKRFDGDFPIGKAPREVPCSCGGKSKRVYSGMSIGVKVGSYSRPSSFGERRKQENLQAGERMKGRKAPIRVVAHDYGNGDIREVAGVK